MSTNSPQPPFRNLNEAADVVGDIDYRHMYTEIEDEDKNDFAQRLGRLLDLFARVGIPVVHISTTMVVDHGYHMRVAQIVVRMHRGLLAQFEDGDSNYILSQRLIDQLIGCETTPPASQNPT